MRNSRGICVWSALATCGVVVLGAMGWITQGVLDSEKDRAEAEAKADLEERTRLALWRMDTAGSAILLAENQRPPSAFRMSSDQAMKSGDSGPLVHLHFQAVFGSLMSPEVDQDSLKFQELRGLLAKNRDISSVLNQATQAWQDTPKEASEAQSANTVLNNSGYYTKRSAPVYQQNSNVIEKALRAKVMESQEAVSKEGNRILWNSPHPESLSDIQDIGSMRAVWIEKELFLLRQVSIGNAGVRSPVIQGVWMDGEKVKLELLASISDLLPMAGLEMAATAGTSLAQVGKPDDPLALVSFPFRLQRDPHLPLSPLPLSTPLLVGWAAVILAILTTSFLVHNVMRLSERRASFVSAVTHELRTPLTTFRLYSDMLETGAVKPEKRGDYLRVLSREADRLSHLVENVLSFSQIERGSARSKVSTSSISELLEPMRERLEARLATAGLSLKWNLEDPTAERRVRVDAASVEHILFNLIDNAAKYANSGNPPFVEMALRDAGKMVEVIVRDHGPGIPISERRRIFQAFHKSAREAAESQPGVGLGLALSRRLAKSLGGSLDCVASGGGACFILRLPVA